MKLYLKIAVISLSLCGLLAADQVTLKNGDVVSGTIEKKDGDNLVMKTEFMGEVTIPWNAVTAVKSDNPLYVKLPQGKEVTGTVSTENKEVTVTTPTAAAAATAPIGQIATIRNAAEQAKYERLLAPGWLDLWAGYFDLGFAIARGNARTDTLTTSFNAARATNNDKTQLFFNQIYSTATVVGTNGVSTNAPTANAARGGISYDHNINSRWFWDVMTTEEYDAFQNLDFRFVGGGGLGFHAIKTDRTTLDLLLGGNYTHETFSFTGPLGTAVQTTRNLGEANAGDDFTHKLTGVTSITQSLRYYVAPSTGEYRLAFNAGASTTIHKWLSWQISVTDNYLSAPVFGRKSNDILLTTGLRATFAR
ncbi:MAG TPA: DUF481 domain-containing protein [Bryobacteraceae bacterium]|jgi:hypothetical protein|nr:DUF481 domain-containing protein [Bryobacteraceae bacterium]